MKKIYAIFFTVFFSSFLFAQSGQESSIESIIKKAPVPQKLVNDFTNTLTADQRETLERKLYQFDDTTSNQIVVVIVDKLDGMDVADAAIQLGKNWGVGSKKNNNGVVLLISKTDRKLNIAPGYGLEKSLPDLVCQQIIQTIIVPNFKGNDFYGGIDRGTDAIMQASKGEFKAPDGYNKRAKSDGGASLIFIIVVIIVVIMLLRGGGGGGNFMSRRGFMPIFFPGGFGGGGGGSSSGGGGGFGGFGGGDFGGGGSSGSW